ncbi:hypothetical protein KIH74_21295 [Kineosporia sp. J2-2]|uniref:Cyanobacterial TRADD-N associated 2 transmembrane domain-containing protein n=1 Tax=Kineosporia corallincola TaxID=2835133 RepID=A0ABS5TK66_9ACTN|nr:hypothetical protein [Kineosporia corallincola]MBT0771487.1 hypothetical protein [Kineosporia corallincola]
MAADPQLDLAADVIDLTDAAQARLGHLPAPRLVLADFAPRSKPELHIAATLLAYRGAASISGLVSLISSLPACRTALGLGLRTAAWTSLTTAIGACVLLTAGQVHATHARARLAPDTRKKDEPAAGPDRTAAPDDPVRANEMQVRSYQELALSQARSSYRQSQSAIGATLGILLVGTVSVMFWAQEGTQAVVGALTALGTTISAFPGKTFLDERNRSVRQLNRSYALPLTKNLLIFAQDITRDVKSDQKRDALVATVLSTTLAAVRSTMSGSWETESAARPKLPGRKRIRHHPGEPAGNHDGEGDAG